jgi:SAM-dependent methyltransferase
VSTQIEHPMLAHETHDDGARQEFTRSLKLNMFSSLIPGNKRVYEGRVAPAFRNRHGRDPKDRHEIRREMLADPFYQMFSSIKRTQQELMWSNSGETTERSYENLQAQKARLAKGKSKGSLTLNPDVEVPRYNQVVDIHIQPGGYGSEMMDDDFFAGALYDHAVYSYGVGTQGGLNDDMGKSVIKYLRENYPKFKPRRILDMGCAAGQSTLPYCDAYPGAEVHAIDVGAPMLRYAHARAEGLGKAVHFRQASAEATDYPDGHFDLIVSHILLHETSRKAIPNILRETRRLLAPGGIAVHAEVPGFFKYREHPVDHIAPDWEAHYNDEPFMPRLFEMDLIGEAEKAGFAKGKAREGLAPAASQSSMMRGAWYMLDLHR